MLNGWALVGIVVVGLLLTAGVIIGIAVNLPSENNKENIPVGENEPQDDLTKLVRGNSEFAFDLYQEIRDDDGNIFFSPYSISAALAMTYAGARSDTAQQMSSTLHFTLPQETLHSNFNILNQALTDNSGEFTLNIANALWGQSDTNFISDFLDLLNTNYGAGMRLVNFKEDPEGARIGINDWVENKTENKIKDLLPPGVIDELTRLVLANAIYFKADWVYQFAGDLTADSTFTLLDDSQITVPMMSLREGVPLSYCEGDGYKAVEMPYKGTTISMFIILPDTDLFEDLESTLSAERVSDISESLESQLVKVKMPKFQFEKSLDLNDTLSAMGMPVAFTEQADFSGITTDENLHIDKILHKAFVAVDENGTEAAAATVVVAGVTCAPPPCILLTIDHPFVFLIRDSSTGAILFLGRVLDPTA